MPALGELEVATTSEGSSTVVSLSGEIDLVTAPVLRAALSDALDREGLRVVVVDLAAVPFLDSSGLGTIAAANKRARVDGVEIRLCGVQPQVRRVLELTGLAAHWSVFDDSASACGKAPEA